MKNLLMFFGIVFISILLLEACGKQTLVSKPYHNLTGRYNAYYNANLRITESFDMLNKQHQDNYNKFLHMYPYAAVPDANSVKQPLDEAITKCARNIKLHTIGNWTDDSYYLLGQAEFLQQDYKRAVNTFKFIVDKYHPENVAKELAKLKKKKKGKKKGKKKRRRRTKKKKKKNKKKKKPNGDPDEEEEKPIKYGIKHRPVRYKAMLWLAKTHLELNQYDEAGYFLRQLESDLKVPYKLRPKVQAVIAYSWVKQKEYEKAIEPLEKAIAGTKRKTVKNRYVYLLGQIYQLQNNSELAMENFHKVLRLKPSYEMEFNARLNMAKNAASVTGKKKIDPQLALKRMLRDSKNEEYKDQIYFALAEIKLNAGNKDQGILDLQQSLIYSSSNAQRTEGCFLLAQLFYEKDDFITSYAYYDSTVMVMDKKDERYVSTDLQKLKLLGVATNMAIVMDKDSMRKVGSWERQAQERWAVEAMEVEANAVSTDAPTQSPGRNIPAKNAIKENASMAGMPNRGRTSKGGPNGPISVSENALQKSKFSLYNSSLKKKGEREFEKRWDGRAWADNWRRADAVADESFTNEGDLVAAVPKTQAEIDGYLKRKGVPMNDQEKRTLKNKLAEARFKAAEHYREDLGRKDKALDLVQRLVTSYPESEFAVEAMFLAYNIHAEDNNTTLANHYKNQILTKYPESNIAKVLSDPDFANSEKIKYQKINKYYDETYSMIKGGQAQQALERVRAVPTEFGNNYEMKARFAILEAMCVGGMKGEKDYIKALRVIITSFPNTDEEIQAKAMIAILNGTKTGKKTTVNNNNSNPGAPTIFKENMKTKHLVLVVFDNKKAKVNQYRAPITEFNNKYYLSTRLNTSSILVNAGTTPSLTIRAFANGDLAMKYVVNARSNAEFLPAVEGYTIYAISQQNYSLAISQQKFSLYATFFDKHYR